MRWAYPKGLGQVCWYCDRVFKTEESHKWGNRKAYEHALVTNMEVLNNHHARRDAFLQRRREGHKYVEHLAGPVAAAAAAAPAAAAVVGPAAVAAAAAPAPIPRPPGPQLPAGQKHHHHHHDHDHSDDHRHHQYRLAHKWRCCTQLESAPTEPASVSRKDESRSTGRIVCRSLMASSRTA